MSELAPLHTSLESLAHRTAKGALLLWLRDAASTAGYDHEARLGRLAWRVNRGGPHYGIWSEYPIVAGGNGNERVWDELDERWFDAACRRIEAEARQVRLPLDEPTRGPVQEALL